MRIKQDYLKKFLASVEASVKKASKAINDIESDTKPEIRGGEVPNVIYKLILEVQAALKQLQPDRYKYRFSRFK